MTAQHRMSLTEWGLLALLSLLWGGSFFFAKIAVGALPPLPLGRTWAARLAVLINDVRNQGAALLATANDATASTPS